MPSHRNLTSVLLALEFYVTQSGHPFLQSQRFVLGSAVFKSRAAAEKTPYQSLVVRGLHDAEESVGAASSL